MGDVWDAFKKSYKTEGLTGAKTASGSKAYAYETGYNIGAEVKIGGFQIDYVRRRSGLSSNQQVLVVLSNLKFQRYFISSGSLALYNTYDSKNARSRLLGKRINQWIEREGLKPSDVPARASYQAANPSAKDRAEVVKHGGSDVWIEKEGGEAKDMTFPKIPSLPGVPSLFSMPSFKVSGMTKAIGAIVVGFVVLVVLLIAVGYSGMGGSVGRVAESEHARKRK